VHTVRNVDGARACDDFTIEPPGRRRSPAILSVKLRPLSGWRSSVTIRKLRVPIWTDDGEVVAAVDTITWYGGRIEPGAYEDFAILASSSPAILRIS
jgi:hypothetical protein